MSSDLVDVDVERLDAICRRYGIARLLVFGSVARGEPTPSSDVEVLYDLLPGARLGRETDELADVVGRPVDLVASTALPPLLRATVLSEARPVHAA